MSLSKSNLIANSGFLTFRFIHRIPDEIIQIVESDQIANCLYSLATNLNADKPKDIQNRPNINE
jgi:hypothetical protein